MKFIILTTTIFILFSASVHAEFMGMIPGRSARVQAHEKASIEIGASWYTNQLQWSAVRFNIKPSQGLTLFFDYAKLSMNNIPINASEKAGFLGHGFGGGVLFGVPDFLTSFDIAFKAAYHASDTANKLADISQSQKGLELYQQQWNADFIISPIDPIFENGLSWYGSVGFVSTNGYARFTEQPLADSGSLSYEEKAGWALGAGIVKPLKFGSFYSGVEWLSSEPLLATGIRYSF